MPNFLFEILLEEVPHSILPKTAEHIQTKLPSLLHKYGLNYTNISYYTTPRRFSFCVQDLPERGCDRVIEQKGPSVKAAYDDQGNPTKALEGFFASYNVSKDDIEEREIKGQQYIFVQKTEEGALLANILPNLLEELIDSIQFSQPMRWNCGDVMFEFIRPVRGITALIDHEILPLSFFGLKSNRILKGHRQLFRDPITLNHSDDYEKILKQNGCIPHFDERKHIIQQQAEEIANSINAQVLLDEELLMTLASLTEYPHLLLAEFNQNFLSLPQEVLISEMKIHQKYIPLVDKKGQLLPNYIITANIPVDDSETKANVLSGNDRVLTARFTDGKFFFDEDIKKGLPFYAESLQAVAFVDGAGSIADKIDRVHQIALYLRNKLASNVSLELLKEAVQYSKADLSSLMVGEFPELQGIIGSYYAKYLKCDPSVSLAIKEHYYPMMIDGELVNPTQELSALVGLADRLDNLFTLYAVGKTVTGSKDPYALRRQTIALISLITQFKWQEFSLEDIFNSLSDLYKPILMIEFDQWKQLIVDFIKVRLEGILKSNNLSVDTINAALSKPINYLLDDIDRVEALQQIRTQEQDRFEQLIELAKRINNMLKDYTPQPFQEKLLVESAEKELYKQYQMILQKCHESSHINGLLELVKLEQFIRSFFDNIMVKTGDEKEINRLSLLHQISLLLKEYADFAKLS